MLAMLLTMVDDGRRDALTELYLAHHRKMYAVAFHIFKDDHRAQDAVYESFVKIIEHFEKINSLSCNEKASYIVTIVKNTSLNLIKSESHYAELSEEWDVPSREPGPEGDAGYGYLKSLILAMPEGYRSVLELALVLEWTTKEIAAELKLNESTVKTRLARGRKMLQEQLRKEGYFDDGARV